MKLLGPESAVTHRQVSITDQLALDALISDRKPDVVFNCAAYNAVDRAETEQDLAFAVNAVGTRHVAVACANNDVSLVHFSTNFVFDG